MNDLNDDHGDDLNLQDLWQKTPPVNVAHLVKSVEKAQRRMRFMVYYEIASTILGLFLFVWIFKEKLFGDQLWIPITLALIVFAGQAWAFTWRKGLWNAFAKSPAELFELKRRHFLLDIKVARSVYGGILVGGLLGALGVFFDVGERTLELTEWVRGSILALLIGGMVYFFIWGIRKEIKVRKQLKELDKQIKEYENSESL